MTKDKKAPARRSQNKAPALRPRTIACKLCKTAIEFSPGLEEMSKHWEVEHPDALAKMRGKHNDDIDRSRW